MSTWFAHGRRSQRAGEKSQGELLAVVNGREVASSDKKAAKDEQRILKDADYYENKEKNHIKGEENYLREKRKLLDRVRTAYNGGDRVEVDKFEKKLDKAVEAEKGDASMIDSVIRKEHHKVNQLQSSFSKWAARDKHPIAKSFGRQQGRQQDEQGFGKGDRIRGGPHGRHTAVSAD